MATITIEHQDQGARGRYVARIEGVADEAELTYARPSPQVVRANHTEAPGESRGTGAARALVERLFADARAQGFKVNPACSYVRKLADSRPEWADLIAH